VARALVDPGPALAWQRDLWSDARITVDGTLIEAWAGQKSFKRKAADPPGSPPDDPGNPRLDNKARGQEAKLTSRGHVRREHRHRLVVDTRLTQATGTAEREAALAMAEAIPGQQRVTLGADKHDDTLDCVRTLRELRVPPPMARQPSGRSSALEARTTRHPGSVVRQRQRIGVEARWGWRQTVGLRRQTRHRGVGRVGWMCTLAAAVSTLVRMRTLAAVA
jgi:hypothetical protein